MSLNIIISSEEQPNSFFVYDCTGNYSADNLGGWGGPNPKTSDIQSATLTITPPQQNLPVHVSPGQLDTIVLAPVGTPTYTLTTSPDFPSVDDKQGYEVLPYMVGCQDNKVTSGKWRITLTVTGVFGPNNKPFKASGFIDVCFINAVTCCVDKLQKYIDVQNHKDKKSVTINELNNLLVDANYSIGCGLLDQANGIISLLNQQCICLDC